jgi:hypothetical protein
LLVFKCLHLSVSLRRSQTLYNWEVACEFTVLWIVLMLLSRSVSIWSKWSSLPQILNMFNMFPTLLPEVCLRNTATELWLVMFSAERLMLASSRGKPRHKSSHGGISTTSGLEEIQIGLSGISLGWF